MRAGLRLLFSLVRSCCLVLLCVPCLACKRTHDYMCMVVCDKANLLQCRAHVSTMSARSMLVACLMLGTCLDVGRSGNFRCLDACFNIGCFSPNRVYDVPPRCLPDACQTIPQQCFHSNDSTTAIPQPGFLSNDSTAMIPQQSFHTNDSTALNPPQ